MSAGNAYAHCKEETIRNSLTLPRRGKSSSILLRLSPCSRQKYLVQHNSHVANGFSKTEVRIHTCHVRIYQRRESTSLRSHIVVGVARTRLVDARRDRCVFGRYYEKRQKPKQRKRATTRRDATRRLRGGRVWLVDDKRLRAGPDGGRRETPPVC